MTRENMDKLIVDRMILLLNEIGYDCARAVTQYTKDILEIQRELLDPVSDGNVRKEKRQ